MKLEASFSLAVNATGNYNKDMTSLKAAIEDTNSRGGNDSGQKFNVKKQESKVWKELDNVKGMDRKTSGYGKNKKCYEWDYTHNDIEVYNNKGQHQASMNPVTGEMYKGPVKGRTIKIN